MNRGKTCYIAIILLMVSMIPLANAGDFHTTDVTDEGYLLDQMQTKDDGLYYPVTMDNPAAQSFQPTLTPLAKVRLYVHMEGELDPCESNKIKVSIRSDLDEADLTSVMVDSSLIPKTLSWVNFDFDDITVDTVEPETTYYIVLQSFCTEGELRWFSAQNQDIDSYEFGSGWYLYISGGGIISWQRLPDFTDFCFKTYSYSGKEPDLECSGTFGWPDQKPGGTITDSFSIANVGDSNSLLNWEIAEFPEWGEWTFDPAEGKDLRPEDGLYSVGVTVIIPDQQNADFSGSIKIVNKDNSSDYEIINVQLSTPKHIRPHFFDYLPTIIQRFLQLFPILNWII